MAWVAVRADGGGVDPHPRPDDLVARGVYTPRLPGGYVGQAADERRAGGPGVLRGTRRQCPRPGVRGAQAGDGGPAHRGRRLHRLSRRAAVHHCRQGRGDPGGGRIVV